MASFVPPYPDRPAKRLSPWRRVALGRKNLIGQWEAEAFGWNFISARVLGRLVFLCNTPDAVKFVLGGRNGFEQKSREVRRALRPLCGEGSFISHGETWRKRRDVMAPLVHASRLRQFAPIMVEAAVEARDRWAAAGEGALIDALGDMARLASDVIARTLFGRQLGRTHGDAIVDGFGAYQRAVVPFGPLDLIGAPEWIPRRVSPATRRAVATIDSVLDEIFAELRSEGDAAEASLVGQLLTSPEGAALTEAELREEVAVLFLAGHETTANTLAWIWYLLSQAPEVEARLHAELDEVLAGREPALADVPKLVYLRAVVDEALRLYPPGPFLARECTAETRFRDRRIPRGADMVLVPWLLHRHKRLWPEPDAFDPDRFLPGGSGAPSKYAYIPFGAGPRVCPGMAFGLAEAALSLAVLAQRFTLTLEPGHVVEPVAHMALRPGDALPMTVHGRML